MSRDRDARFPEDDEPRRHEDTAKGETDAEETLSYGFRGGFSPLPGDPAAVPAGTRMVCPVDRSHYRRRLQQRGQRPRCPEHDVELVPE